jgi:hypothetical protein
MHDNDGASSYVMLSDTLDQWRMKTNEWLSMTNDSGSSNSIKTNDTTNSTSNTTGAITTAGGMGLGSSAIVVGNLTLFGGTDLKGTFNIDDVDIDGAVQIDGAVTVGVDGTGLDVKFFGDTSGQYMLWDQSEDELVLPGDTKLSFHDAAGGENIIASADGHLEINAGTTLDITAPTVDINASTTLNVDGATQLTGAVTVGVDDTGHDVQFFGATSGQHLLWDQSADELALIGDTKLSFHDAGGGENIIATSDGHLEINSGTTLDITAPTVDINASTALNVDGPSQLSGAVTVGVDDTGYDVKFFGATASAFMLWDASADDLILSGAAALSIDTTTDATNTTSGSFHTDGGVGIAKKLFVGTDLDVNGTSNLDIVDIDGAVQIDGTVTVGVDNTGHDVKLFGATSGKYWQWDESADKVIAVSDLQQTGTLTVGVDGTGHDVQFFGDTAGSHMIWDQSADELALTAASKLSFHDAAGGENIVASADGHLEINAGTTLDITAPTVDVNVSTTLNVDGATQLTGAVTVGVDDTGHDVQFFGATSGQHLLWDQSADELALVGDTKLSFHDAAGAENIIASSDGHLEINSGTTLDITAPTVDINVSTVLNVDGATQLTGDVTVGVDNTGHDVKFFGATAGAYFEWDQSADELELRGGAATPGKLLLSTAEATVVDGNKLGQIDFQAPAETGTDAIVVGASIVAEADATFSGAVNSTDLLFLTADSGAATEKFRIDSTGQVTFADGAIDVDIASHVSHDHAFSTSNGLKLGGTLVKASAAELNNIVNEKSLGQVAGLALVFAS